MAQSIADAIRIRYPSTSVEIVDETQLFWKDIVLGMNVCVWFESSKPLQVFQEYVQKHTLEDIITGAIYLSSQSHIDTIGDFAIQTCNGWPVIYLGGTANNVMRSVGIVTSIMRERHDVCRVLNYGEITDGLDTVHYDDLSRLAENLVNRVQTNNGIALKALSSALLSVQRVVEKLNSDVKRLHVVEKAAVEISTCAQELRDSKLLSNVPTEETLTEKQKIRVYDMVKKYADFYQTHQCMPKYNDFLAAQSRFPKRHKQIVTAAEAYLKATIQEAPEND